MRSPSGPYGMLAAPVKMLVRPFPRLNAALSAAIWNFQYKRDQWNYLDSESGRQPLSLVEEYVPDAKILDLGCGTSANLPLAPGRYRHYHGVDISAIAIERARALGRPDTSFETADILTYQTHERSRDRQVGGLGRGFIASARMSALMAEPGR